MNIEAGVQKGVSSQFVELKKRRENKKLQDPARVRPNMFDGLHIGEYSKKRLFDMALGGLALLGFLVLLPFIAIGIKVSSRGPIFFKQPRTGKNGMSEIQIHACCD